MKFFRIQFLFIVLLLVNIKSYSQQKEPVMWLGGYIGYNANQHFVSFNQLPNVPNCCPDFTDGKGTGFSFGGLMEFQLLKSLHLNIKFGFSDIGATLTKTEDIGFSVDTTGTSGIFKDKNGSLVSLAHVYSDHSLTAKIMTAGIEPSINFKFIDKLNSYIGMRIAYMFTGQVNQMEKIVSPNDITFIGGSTIRNQVNDIQIPGKNSLQIFGMIGLGYDIEIGEQTFIVPEIRYYIPVMDISSLVQWKATTFSFGASVKFPIFDNPKPPPTPEFYDTTYVRDTLTITKRGIEEDTINLKSSDEENFKITKKDSIIYQTKLIQHFEKWIPEKDSPLTQVIVTGITKEGKRQEKPSVVIEEIEEEESFPILPYVFFKEGSADLSQTGLRFTSSSFTRDYITDNLKRDALVVYNDMLNIYGQRLRLNPTSKITITGCNDNLGVEKNNLQLSVDRANAVKQYFIDVWKINPSQIIIKKQNLPTKQATNTHIDGQEENRRAEISSNDYNIIKPLTLRKIDRTSNPPVIEINPEIKTKRKIKTWKLNIVQGGFILRSMTGSGKPGIINWHVDEEPIPKLELPVEFQITAITDKGMTTGDTARVNIKQLTIKKKREEIKNDIKFEKFSLIVFDFNQSELTPLQQPIMDDIKARILPDSKVTIQGYTDRTGEEAHNKDLALKRCMTAKKYLGLSDDKVKMEAVGSEQLIYDNGTPQGRNYCRTIKISIETPVKKS